MLSAIVVQMDIQQVAVTQMANAVCMQVDTCVDGQWWWWGIPPSTSTSTTFIVIRTREQRRNNTFKNKFSYFFQFRRFSIEKKKLLCVIKKEKNILTKAFMHCYPQKTVIAFKCTEDSFFLCAQKIAIIRTEDSNQLYTQKIAINYTYRRQQLIMRTENSN